MQIRDLVLVATLSLSASAQEVINAEDFREARGRIREIRGVYKVEPVLAPAPYPGVPGFQAGPRSARRAYIQLAGDASKVQLNSRLEKTSLRVADEWEDLVDREVIASGRLEPDPQGNYLVIRQIRPILRETQHYTPRSLLEALESWKDESLQKWTFLRQSEAEPGSDWDVVREYALEFEQPYQLTMYRSPQGPASADSAAPTPAHVGMLRLSWEGAGRKAPALLTRLAWAAFDISSEQQRWMSHILAHPEPGTASQGNLRCDIAINGGQVSATLRSAESIRARRVYGVLEPRSSSHP